MIAPLNTVLDDARSALDGFVAALNTHDVAAWADTMHFPHLRIHDGVSTVWHDREGYLSSGAAEMEALLGTGWRYSEWDEVDIVQSCDTQVHFATRFARRDAEGGRLSTLDTIYVVVLRDGRWGTVARLGFVRL